MTNAERQAEWRKNHPTESRTLDKERKRQTRGFYDRLQARLDAVKLAKRLAREVARRKRQADDATIQQVERERQAALLQAEHDYQKAIARGEPRNRNSSLARIQFSGSIQKLRGRDILDLFFLCPKSRYPAEVIGDWWNAFQSWYVWRWSGWVALAAIGTVGALGAALFQIGAERRRRHRQEEKDREERHSAQARLIAAMVGPKERPKDSDTSGLGGRSAIDLVNGSEEPVYQLVVGIVCIQGTCPESLEKFLEFQNQRNAQEAGSFATVPITTVSILPRGTFRVWIQGTGWSSVLSGRAGAEVAFTDRAGSHWIRRASGSLEELPKPPFDYFHDLGLYGPYELLTPERIP
jgi:hypothetical protein